MFRAGMAQRFVDLIREYDDQSLGFKKDSPVKTTVDISSAHTTPSAAKDWLYASMLTPNEACFKKLKLLEPRVDLAGFEAILLNRGGIENVEKALGMSCKDLFFILSDGSPLLDLAEVFGAQAFSSSFKETDGIPNFIEDVNLFACEFEDGVKIGELEDALMGRREEEGQMVNASLKKEKKLWALNYIRKNNVVNSDLFSCCIKLVKNDSDFTVLLTALHALAVGGGDHWLAVEALMKKPLINIKFLASNHMRNAIFKLLSVCCGSRRALTPSLLDSLVEQCVSSRKPNVKYVPWSFIVEDVIELSQIFKIDKACGKPLLAMLLDDAKHRDPAPNKLVGYAQECIKPFIGAFFDGDLDKVDAVIDALEVPNKLGCRNKLLAGYI